MMGAGVVVLAMLAATLGARPAAGAETAPLPSLRWVPATAGAVPPAALAGGAEAGTDLYLCRGLAATAGVDRRVGNLRPGQGCEVPLGVAGTAMLATYEVLVGPPWMITWSTGADVGRDDIVVGGDWQGQPAALCQVEQGGEVHGGTWVGGRCMAAVGGKTLTAEDFRFAVANPSGAFAMRWATGGWTPQGALTAAGGTGGTGVICLAESAGAWWPGGLDGGRCRAVVDGPTDQVLAAVSYQTVIGDPARVAWTSFVHGRPPMFLPEEAVAIAGGNDAGPAILVCRAEVGGRLRPGGVTADRHCAVPLANGGVARLADFDVLFYRQGEARTAASQG
jgi:hypothetical protein